MNNNVRLRARLDAARRRLQVIGAVEATVWAVIAAAVLLVVAAWLDLVWELAPQGRIAASCSAGAVAAIFLLALAYRRLRTARFDALARRLDIAVHSPGEILTGWELDRRAQAASAPLTAGLVTMAAERAEALAGKASLAVAIPAKPLGRAAAVLAAMALSLGVLALAMPELVKTQWNRFTRPFADIPPYSPYHFTLTPGNAHVLYGEDLEIAAKVEGAVADHLELVLENADGSQASLPMFSESGGAWRAVLSKLTEPTTYFVRCYRARSERYKIDIITVPRIESVRVQVVPPEYADQPTYEGPVPDEGLKGLPGTHVTVWAVSNRPLSGGKLVVSRREGEAPANSAAKLFTVADKSMLSQESHSMRPTESGAQEVLGEFAIHGNGRFELHVTDADNQSSQQSFAANVTLLKDQTPIVRMIKPQPESLATPTAMLPLLVAAEDDCGISRLELFRSLNHSRPLPAGVPLPIKRPHRRDEPFALPLAAYGLEPGDVLTFFARVEDNDPAGAKGSETPVVSVKIISQEDFDHLLRVREGVAALASKYRQAQRRMEGLAKKMDGLRKKLQKEPGDKKLAEETRKELRELQRLMHREAHAMRMAAAHRMPFDIDDKLSPEIEKAAELTDKMAEELEKLDKLNDLTSKELEKKLAAMSAQMKKNREQYASSAMEPIEGLEEVFPLLADQQRFIMLAKLQADLAQRMESLKGHNGDDDPAIKTRMRDLEHEQAKIRVELDNLLGDIEDHATRLPDREELQKLRETALQFAKDVRASGATEAMTAGEAALTDFSGDTAHEKAQEAADILDRFIARCQGEGDMQSQCRGALAFKPKLSQCLGNSIAQMLAEMGMGMGQNMGSGSGMGSGNGSVGLYGATESDGGEGSGERGDPENGGGTGSGDENGTAGGTADNRDAFAPDEAAAAGTATAGSEAVVPMRYRRAVRQYFQRLNDELGDRTPAKGPH